MSTGVYSGDGDPISEWIIGQGGARKITRVSSVGGGCINNALRYDTDAGSFFVKINRQVTGYTHTGPMICAGSNLLKQFSILVSLYLDAPGARERNFRSLMLVHFEISEVGPLSRRGSYIIMEYIHVGESKGGQAELGRKLAEMHKAGKTDKGFGFDVDNTIGRSCSQDA